MKNELFEEVNEFIENRIVGSRDDIMYKSERYVKVSKSMNDMIDEIAQRLGEDPKQSKVDGTADKLIEVICDVLDCHDRYAYIQGFKDAQEIKGMIA